MTLSSSQIAELLRLHDLCGLGTETERQGARARRREWLTTQIDHGTPLEEIATTLGIAVEVIEEWIASESVLPQDSSAFDFIDNLVRRRLPGAEPRRYDTRYNQDEPFRGISRTDTWGAGSEADRSFLTDYMTSHYRPRHESHTTTIHFISGSPDHGNRFTTEIAVLRRLVGQAHRRCEEHSDVAGEEIGDLVHSHPSSILHLSFHSVHGVVELADSSQVGDVTHVPIRTFASAIMDHAPPGLLVLAGCSSIAIAEHLGDWATATIAWPAETNDQDTLRYCRGLYVGLLRGGTVEASHRTGLANLGSVGEDLHPQCLGNLNWCLRHGRPL